MANKKPDNPERREYLKFLGGAGIIGAGSMLAGCSGGGSDNTESTDNTMTSGAESTNTGGSSDINKGGELIVAMQAGRTDPFWPHWASGTTGSQIMRQMTNTLTYVTADGDLIGDLAEEPPKSDDAKTYTVKIREGVMFQEPYNREVTADDVVKNFYAILDPTILAESTDGDLYKEYATAGRWPFPGLLWGDDIDTKSRVKKVDKYTIKFELAKPNAAFPALVSIGQCAILPMEMYEDNPDDVGSVDLAVAGTGPFLYDGGQEGDSYTLKRNPNYFRAGENGQLPYLDTITYRIIPEAAVRITNLKTGDIHLTESIPSKDVDEIDNTDGLRGISKPGGSHIENYLNIRGWDPLKLYDEDPQLDKDVPAYGTINENGKKMRQAIRHATNTEQIIKTKFNGKAEPKYAPPPPFDWSYQEDKVTKFEYDPQKAKQLLADTGNQGFKFVANATNQPRFVDTATIAQQSMKQAGIDMEVKPKEKAAAWGPVLDNVGLTNGVSYKKTGYEGHFEDIGSGVDPTDFFAQLLGGNSINYSFFAHEESDQYILDAAATTDRDRRKELYGKALEIITPLAPINGICWPYVNQGIDDSVKNYQVKRSSFRFRLEDVWIEA